MSTPLVRRSPTHTGQVVSTAPLTPRMRRVAVRADSMVGVALHPAQDVELLLREPSGRRVKRRYTIRHARPEDGELDLDVLLHGAGPGSRWGETAQPGDTVEFQGPRGKLELRATDWAVLIGDESALPAIAAICEARPARRIRAIIEVGDASDELPISAATVRWEHRDTRAAGDPELLLAAARDLEFATDTRGQAVLLGETRTMVALRAVLEGKGMPHDAIFVKGYWNIARPDRIAGRAP